MKHYTTQVKRVERRPQLEEEADSDLAAQVLMLLPNIMMVMVMIVMIVTEEATVILTMIVMAMIVTNSPKLSKIY